MFDEEFNRGLDNVGPIEFLKNLNYYRGLNNQLEREVGDFLRNRYDNPKLYSNDLRHQYVSALYGRNLGDNWAERLGNWNEVMDMSGSGREDTEIDKINNEIGRQYAKQYPNLPRQQLLEVLMNDFDKNLQYRRSRMSD